MRRWFGLNRFRKKLGVFAAPTVAMCNMVFSFGDCKTLIRLMESRVKIITLQIYIHGFGQDQTKNESLRTTFSPETCTYFRKSQLKNLPRALVEKTKLKRNELLALCMKKKKKKKKKKNEQTVLF